MRTALIEDAEFLVETGEHWEHAVRRLGLRSASNLEATLRRSGRPDLIAALKANRR